MTYQSPFACMENCAQSQCRNRTTGCQGECQVRVERAAIVKRLRDMLDHEAADRIAELERHNAELRAALEGLLWRDLKGEIAGSIAVSRHDARLSLALTALAAHQKGKAS
jgi:hypothetical protein